MVDLYETLTRSRALLITLNVRKNLSGRRNPTDYWSKNYYHLSI